MFKENLRIILAITLISAGAAQASDFNGGYIGGKLGYNKNFPATNSTSNKIYPGLEAGYGWDIGNTLFAIDAFVDGHNNSITGNDYGADVKWGFPSDKFMPYIKLGLAGSDPGTRVHGGLGIEYNFAPQWSISGEWTADRKSVNSIQEKNSNFTVGLSYYFNSPFVAPAEAAKPAPVVVKQPQPIAAPVPEPVPVVETPPPAPAPVVETPPPAPKTIFTDKPVTIEGANFDSNSSKLKPFAFEQLDKVVEFADKYKDTTLTVVGYTDSSGNEKKNLVLSAKRAESVKAYLVTKGVDGNRIVTSGKGSANPVGDNKTTAGRALNRRVEIRSMVRVPQ